MNFGTNILSQSTKIMQNYVSWILIASFFIISIKTEDFIKILLMRLKDGTIHPTMMKMIKDHFQLVKLKKQLASLKMN